MATTNLTYASLGSIQFSSGNGSPNHDTAISSLYINLDTGTWYKYQGSNIWTPLKVGIYGEIYIFGQTTTIGINAQNTWFTTANRYSWTAGACKGTYGNNNKLQIEDAGLYQINVQGTIKSSATINSNTEFRIIKNEVTTTPLVSDSVRLITTTRGYTGFNGENVVRLVKDDRLELIVRNVTQTVDFILVSCNISVLKITD